MDDIRALAPDALQAYRLHEAATVKSPYVGLGIALVVLAIAIGSFKLPKIPHAQHQLGEKVNDSIWKHPSLISGRDRYLRLRRGGGFHWKFLGELLWTA